MKKLIYLSRCIIPFLSMVSMLTLFTSCSTSNTNLDGDAQEQQSSKDGGVSDERVQEATPTEQVKEAIPEKPAGPDPLRTAELRRVIAKLASDEFDGRDEGTPGGDKAQAWLIEELKRCKIPPALSSGYKQKITTGKGTNLLGLIKGTDPSLKERTIVLSAHYDYLGNCRGRICNGADDNAAGVAIVLGIACKLVNSPLKRSVLVALWDAEEPPTFLKQSMGSLFYVNNPVIPLAKTDAAIVLDLVGSDLWPGFAGHFLLGAELSPEVASAVGATTVPKGLLALHSGLHLVEQTPLGMQPWSDYHGFRQKAIPVLFLSNGQTKRYHQPNDEMASINMPKVTLEAQYLFGIVTNLGNATKDPTFVATGANYKQDAKTMRAVVEAALAPGGIIETLKLSATSRSKLQGDLEKLKDVQKKLEKGGSLTRREIYTLRAAAQRLMCLAGPFYPERRCQLL